MAMEKKALESLMKISTKDFSEVNNFKQHSKLERKDDVSIIKVSGPLFKEACLLTSLYGGNSYEEIGEKFDEAIESNSKGIIFNFDTPGGEVSGCHELSSKIREARGIKPIIAYVSGDACSAGYWLASSCDEIIASKSSVLGSIGVVAVTAGENDEEKGTRIISNQTPFKNIDPKTSEGKKSLQKKVDALAQVFLDDLQANRGKCEGNQTNKTYEGHVYVGSSALKEGLIDKISTFQKVKEDFMSKNEEKTEKAKVQTETRDFAIEERERILEILALKGQEDLTQNLIKEGVSVGEAAIQIRKNELAKKSKHDSYLASVRAAEKELKNLSISTEEANENSAEAIINLAKKFGV